MNNESDFLNWYSSKPEQAQNHSWADLKELWFHSSSFDEFEKHLAKLEGNYPVSYILQRAPFGPYDVLLCEPLLIPRPCTWEWLEAFLTTLPSNPITALDLGCGPGTIGIALAHFLSIEKLVCIDSHPEALKYADLNLTPLFNSRVSFIQSSWFSDCPPYLFDLIIANPPYISDDEVAWLRGTEFEDHNALFSPQGGLADLHLIIQQARNFLKKNAFIALEHGCGQGFAVHKLLSFYGYTHITPIFDSRGALRATVAQYE